MKSFYEASPEKISRQPPCLLINYEYAIGHSERYRLAVVGVNVNLAIGGLLISYATTDQ